MRLQILSDIHDDFSAPTLGSYDIVPTACDLVVVAGDIAGRLGGTGRLWLERQRRRLGVDILVVPGNHDYWRGDLHSEVGRFRDKLQVDGVHVLDGEAIEIDGTRFVGGTLWTDFAAWNGDVHAGKREAVSQMNDYRMIRAHQYSWRLKPYMIEREHRRHREAIETILSAPFDGPTVVVTHHPPSLRSLRTGGVREPVDASYASDMEDVILEGRPDVWIHGHVHEPRDYEIGETRVLANPRGYRRLATRFDPNPIEVPDFRDDLVIEVPSPAPGPRL